MAGGINRDFFFDSVRASLFDGRLGQKQVAGLTKILDFWASKYVQNDDRWLAYALATAHHETGRTMQPIHEFGGSKYFFDMYDKDGLRPRVAKALGNTVAGDGVKFHGRGYIQLTGRANYNDWANRLNLPLTANPDLVLDAGVACRILLDGMVLGTFTGKSLQDYFAGPKAEWRSARQIVNRLDKADLIASYALKYYASISYTV